MSLILHFKINRLNGFCYHLVYQPIDQGIIATLKRKYKLKMLHAIVKNLERYDKLRAVGESIPAGVRGLNQPNLLDVATIAQGVWESIDQTTLINS